MHIRFGPFRCYETRLTREHPALGLIRHVELDDSLFRLLKRLLAAGEAGLLDTEHGQNPEVNIRQYRSRLKKALGPGEWLVQNKKGRWLIAPPAITIDRPPRAEAVVCYERGREQWQRFTPEGLDSGIAEFETAIKLDSEYAAPWAGLADCKGLQCWLTPVQPKYWDFVESAAENSLQLDPECAEGHTAKATYLDGYRREMDKAEASYQRALQINPNYAVGLNYYGSYLVRCGRFYEGLVHLEKAVALNTRDPFAATMCALGCVFSRDSALYTRALDLTLPHLKHHFLASMAHGLALQRRGDFSAAIRFNEQAVNMSRESPVALSWLATCQASAGLRRDAQSTLAALRRQRQAVGNLYFSPYLLARIHAALDEPQETIELLRRSSELRDTHMLYSVVDPPFERMWLNPEYVRIINELGLLQSSYCVRPGL